MEEDHTKIMQPKTIKSKKTIIFLKMEDDLIFFKGREPQIFENRRRPQK